MVASPILLRRIGIKFARSILNRHLNPEQRLWRAVVINAFDETLISQSDRKASLIKINAHNWLLSKSDDFRVVCEYALLDHDDMKECYEEALSKQSVFFTKRQVAWKEYDKFYRAMLSEETKLVRKIKRKEVDQFRKKVQELPDTIISTIFVSAFV